MRVALGARHWDVVRTVAGRTLLLVGIGVAALRIDPVRVIRTD